MYYLHDYHDNAAFCKAFQEIVPKTCRSPSVAFSLALFAGSCGMPDVVKDLGGHVVNARWIPFRAGLLKRDKVFRDGQYNGYNSVHGTSHVRIICIVFGFYVLSACRLRSCTGTRMVRGWYADDMQTVRGWW